jgi:hypothetical protein
VVDVDAADVGLDAGSLSLKLELLQHAGSFKARGAFTNLLARDVPEAGVVAASGGNHGAAVAFAAMSKHCSDGERSASNGRSRPRGSTRYWWRLVEAG